MPVAKVIETHVSWVFLTEDRAYKVKKPVVLPFLDYGTLAARRHFCFEEVRLNRRLAPDVYLGVRALVRSEGGCRLADPGHEDPLEFVVEMRRIPDGSTLAERIADRTIGATDVERLARRIAGFHASAAVSRDPAPFATQLESALDNLVAQRPTPLVTRLRSAVARLCDDCADELSERARCGLVREGHGDLRAEHVVMGDPIQIVDCIEFDPALREIDVGADLAFLVMDLERIGATAEAARLEEEYRAAGGDPGSPRLRALFGAYRACVRALVALVRAEQLGGSERDAAHADADALVRLAWRFVWRSHLPVVLVVCGPAAVGKTTLATELAGLTGLPHLSSDRIRRSLPRDGAELYSEAMTERVYGELGRLARSAPDGAIVDATFRRRSDRATFMRAIAPADPIFVQCTAPAGLVEERAYARLRDPARESDAGPAIARQQLAKFEPLGEIAPERRFTVSCAGRVELSAATVEAKLAGAPVPAFA